MALPLLLSHLIIVVEIVRNEIGLVVIIVRNQAIIRRLAGSFMANRLIGNQSHGLTEMAEHTWLPTLRAPLFQSRVHSTKSRWRCYRNY